MSSRSRFQLAKRKERVRIVLKDDSPIEGYLFCGQEERVGDVLNDNRVFLPVEQLDGKLIYMHKQNIAQLTPKDVKNLSKLPRNPHEMLGIRKDASMEEVKQAYRKMTRHYHPDRLASMDLPEDIMEYANLMFLNINAAYEAVVEGDPSAFKPTDPKKSYEQVRYTS